MTIKFGLNRNPLPRSFSLAKQSPQLLEEGHQALSAPYRLRSRAAGDGGTDLPLGKE